MARVAVAVIGAGQCDADTAALACEIGKLVAERGAVLITGGSTGVMEAASRGAHTAGGLVVGILAEADPAAANPWVDVAIPTGMGQLRNGLVVGECRGRHRRGRRVGHAVGNCPRPQDRETGRRFKHLALLAARRYAR